MELDLGLELISLKKIGEIEPFSHFKISGMGDLTWINGSNGKSGYGFSVEHETMYKIDGYYRTKTENFYFTEEEIKELFIESHIYYDKIYQRDLKINTILNEK